MQHDTQARIPEGAIIEWASPDYGKQRGIVVFGCTKEPIVHVMDSHGQPLPLDSSRAAATVPRDHVTSIQLPESVK